MDRIRKKNNSMIGIIDYGLGTVGAISNIYNKLKIQNIIIKSKKDFSRISSRIKFINLIKQERNDLQKIAISKFSLIKKVLDFISIQKGCHFSRMTGSGSVCFGMFKSEKSAILGLKTIKKKFPRYWCVVTKTI